MTSIDPLDSPDNPAYQGLSGRARRIFEPASLALWLEENHPQSPRHMPQHGGISSRNLWVVELRRA